MIFMIFYDFYDFYDFLWYQKYIELYWTLLNLFIKIEMKKMIKKFFLYKNKRLFL